MKRTIYMSGWFLFALLSASAADDLVIRGSVFCLPLGRVEQERPLSQECILVVPKGYPEFATTTSNFGVFDLRVPYNVDFINTPLFLDFFSNDAQVHSARLIVTPQEVVWEIDAYLYELSSPVVLDVDCEQLSTDSDSCWQELVALREPVIMEKEPRFWQKASVPILGIALGGSAALALLYESPLESANVSGDTLTFSSIHYPQTNLAQLASKQFMLYLSPGGGLAPHYRFTNAPLLNASSIGFAQGSQLGASIELTNAFDLARLSGVQKFERFMFGYGVLYANSQQTTLATSSTGTLSQNLHSDMLFATVSAAKRLNKYESAGVAANMVNQRIQIPQHLVSESGSHSALYLATRDVDSLQVFIDASITLNWQFFRCGLSLNNLWGRSLYSASGETVTTRSAALGLSYLNRHFHAGLDVLVPEQEDAVLNGSMTLFVNNWLHLQGSYMTWNRALKIGPTLKFAAISAGYAFAYNSIYQSSHVIHVWTEF